MPLTQSDIIDHLAELDESLTKKQVKLILTGYAELAYKEAKNDFVLPGLGKLILVKRKARKGRNPQTGEEIKIPAKTVVKFRIAKVANDAILGGSGAKSKKTQKKKTNTKKSLKRQ
jgi:DNA-binding protein HU-beta